MVLAARDQSRLPLGAGRAECVNRQTGDDGLTYAFGLSIFSSAERLSHAKASCTTSFADATEHPVGNCETERSQIAIKILRSAEFTDDPAMAVSNLRISYLICCEVSVR